MLKKKREERGKQTGGGGGARRVLFTSTSTLGTLPDDGHRESPPAEGRRASSTGLRARPSRTLAYPGKRNAGAPGLSTHALPESDEEYEIDP